ncbi:MAG: fructose-1,6-bisphosphatase [Clostridia bacterium]|nr:fructose-1,6-bisphosphatase [Clostridia bacterium]
MKACNEKFLDLLGEKYPSVQAATSEIINLEAILRLPKGTEHFVSDLHGEYEAFCHLMNSQSGAIREKVDMLFSKALTEPERARFATLIYYPQQVIEEEKAKESGDALNEWYKTNLYRLADVCRLVASKYTRSKVRKVLPDYCGYIIDELINVDRHNFNKEEYYNGIFDAIIELGRAEAYIISLTKAIKALVVDHLHIVGDIYDRGDSPDKILDMLCEMNSIDIQWGNHDVLWMGAAMGQDACVADVVRISLKYGNADLLEKGYGISLRQLAFYADKMEYDPHFKTSTNGKTISKADHELAGKMHKAIFTILFKMEGKTLHRHPEYNMVPILDRLDVENGTLTIDGTVVKLNSNDFPTIDPADPYKLTEEEQIIFDGFKQAFLSCEKLQRHLAFFMNKGSLYKVYNNNLIFHGCIPLDENGDYADFVVGDKVYRGKGLMDYSESCIRNAYNAHTLGKCDVMNLDWLWYSWCGALSPLFGKDKMTTFERIYIDDKAWHKEKKNSYYKLCQQREWCEKLLRDFGIEGPHSHIINGHVPVKEVEGENPIKADGKLLVIDGGFCKAYHKTTGIAGYTLIFNSHGMELAAHEPFTGVADAIENCTDIHSRVRVFERVTDQGRMTVAETDMGEEIKGRIEDLKDLVERYRAFESKTLNMCAATVLK